ncbi:hypothetical protein NON08_12040 [Cetobacterium somerae]|uniref:tyrosine-protein phosphatase n=1 Tax=Cetobacterium sp. NK01 TaxID=2993530 RepID=UPI002115FC57|nr:CpsB/CapC family capsule biosynthesis tyrosine phosphatase [Cetobacterium sp. NK01]MCQ8213230.1 hypothetical protein [Cetobacterium sp. NK01]
MVDIHTHLLFGVDDGPKTLEESIEMIRDAIEVGFNEFYLTAHYNKGRFCNINYDKNYEILKKRCEELNLKVKLHKGNEVYLDEKIDLVLEKGEFNTIKDNLLLVEFSPLTPPNVGKHLLKKVLEKGFTPILAHVERYSHFRGSDLVELKKLGVKLQVNMCGDKPKYIVRLLNEGYIDYLGSDAHGTEKRSYKEIKKEGKKNEKTKSTDGIFNTFFRSIFRRPWLRSHS